VRNLVNNTHAKQALLGTFLVAALGVTGCSESAPRTSDAKVAVPTAASASDAPATYSMSVSGYPLDRTLDNLVNMRDVDTMVVIEGAKFSEPRWIGAAGKGGFGGDAPGSDIVTPLDASVSRVFRGTASEGDPIRIVLSSGRIGDYEVVASTEVAAQPEDIAKYSSLLVAGETITSKVFGQILNPFFVYGIDADGRATSLMESASEEEAAFPMAELQERLKQGR
jgi:hypothetical protein